MLKGVNGARPLFLIKERIAIPDVGEVHYRFNPFPPTENAT